MLIVDRNAEFKLTKTLEALRNDIISSRCVVMKLSVPIASSDEFRQKLITSASVYLHTQQVQMFFCEDGDIFILAPMIPTKDCNEFALSVGDYLHRPVENTWLQMLELPLHLNQVLMMVDAKLQKILAEEEEEKRQQEALAAERKRELILNQAPPAINPSTLQERRAARSHIEVMLIEDDAFSRRLVENALHKLYNVTSLGEARYALEDYVRIAPDVVFLDIDLPDVTGHELLTRFIALDSQAYIIMLSGNADRDNIMQALNMGAKGFVGKPFTKEKLLQYIERCPTFKPHQ